MPLTDFYSLSDISVQRTEARGTIRLADRHAIYAGHFPGRPVVPGVCLVQIVQELLSKALGERTRLASASFIKFLKVISPENGPALSFQLLWGQRADAVEAQAVFYDSDQVAVFKLKGSFVLPHHDRSTIS